MGADSHAVNLRGLSDYLMLRLDEPLIYAVSGYYCQYFEELLGFVRRKYTEEIGFEGHLFIDNNGWLLGELKEPANPVTSESLIIGLFKNDDNPLIEFRKIYFEQGHLHVIYKLVKSDGSNDAAGKYEAVWCFDGKYYSSLGNKRMILEAFPDKWGGAEFEIK